ncbi:Uncharacterised protein [Bordetella pertussis]|nr:Uncharacterised protein [Bordetella pertussis]
MNVNADTSTRYEPPIGRPRRSSSLSARQSGRPTRRRKRR